jgi:hypothetical protein
MVAPRGGWRGEASGRIDDEGGARAAIAPMFGVRGGPMTKFA